MKILRLLAVAALGLGAACTQAPSKTAPAAAQPAAPAKQITAEQACKDPHIQCLDQPIDISLRMPDGQTFTETLPPPNPLLQYGNIYLFPGLTLYIEADVDGDRLVNLLMVPGNVHPEKTLVLTFEQRETQGQDGMFLSVHNPFARWLKYHAAIADVDTEAGMLKKSTTCPVIPGSNASENWPQPVIQLVLSDFHLLTQDSKE
ncbi:MAG TPA: hypothetical protein VGH71_04600, partial [Gammaproteobacteria bacterium]